MQLKAMGDTGEEEKVAHNARSLDCSAALGCWGYGGYEPTDFWELWILCPHLVMVKPKGREIFGWPSLDWQKLIQHLLLIHQ